jgi:hypothetical protein
VLRGRSYFRILLASGVSPLKCMRAGYILRIYPSCFVVLRLWLQPEQQIASSTSQDELDTIPLSRAKDNAKLKEHLYKASMQLYKEVG